MQNAPLPFVIRDRDCDTNDDTTFQSIAFRFSRILYEVHELNPQTAERRGSVMSNATIHVMLPAVSTGEPRHGVMLQKTRTFLSIAVTIQNLAQQCMTAPSLFCDVTRRKLAVGSLSSMTLEDGTHPLSRNVAYQLTDLRRVISQKCEGLKYTATEA
jgi:hypothetical protein